MVWLDVRTLALSEHLRLPCLMRMLLAPTCACCCFMPMHGAAAAACTRMQLQHALAGLQFFSVKRTRVAPVSSDAWSPKHRKCNRSLSWTLATSTRFSMHEPAAYAHMCLLLLVCLRHHAGAHARGDCLHRRSFSVHTNENIYCNM